ncbi:alpha/beta hydrolase [Bifidobacterium sp.]|uniref:alpha/beta hydrolase n=1 Tax=Bifidobacterium sp. TaxID=41200 RepID=UPI003D7C3A1A
MNQQVTARIIGGKKLSTAEYREYLNTARNLSDGARKLGISQKEFAAMSVELKAHPYIAPFLGTLYGGGMLCMASDHVNLPYRHLLERCEDHARALQAMASQLTELSEAIIRAQSLYERAEEISRRSMNNALRSIFLSAPQAAGVALGLSALKGAKTSFAKEGKLNWCYLVESTAWMQEPFVSAIGLHADRLNIPERPKDLKSTLELITSRMFPLADVKSFDQADHTGRSVNRGLRQINRLLIPYYDATHGDSLTVTRVYPKTDVVTGGKSTKDAIADQRRLSEGPLNGDRESGLEYGTIAICKYLKADGTYAWRITIPGTDGNHDSPMDWYTNFELMSADEQQRGAAESLRFLREAMEQAGIQPDEPVELVGHSQGGIIAAAAAADMQDEYDIQHIATFGSPIANFDIPEKTMVTAIEMDNEGIAALDGAANPNTENWLTIRGSVHEESGTPQGILSGAEVEDSSGERKSTHYLKYHESGYRYAYGTGNKAVLDHDRHFQDVVDGELQETQYYQGRIGK